MGSHLLAHQMEVTISFRVSQEVSGPPAFPVENMDNIKVLVNTGSDSYEINFSQVPAIGEQVRVKDRVYTVRGVIHPSIESRVCC